MIVATVLDGRHFLILWAVVGVTILVWHLYRGRL